MQESLQWADVQAKGRVGKDTMASSSHSSAVSSLNNAYVWQSVPNHQTCGSQETGCLNGSAQSYEPLQGRGLL